MIRSLVAAFLIAHGLVHVAIYAAPAMPNAPSDPGQSWLLRSSHVDTAVMHRGARMLALLALLTAWMCAAAAIGLLLKMAYFHRWLAAGVVLDADLILAAAGSWPPSIN